MKLLVTALVLAVLCSVWAEGKHGHKEIRVCSDGEFKCFQTKASAGIINCFEEA